MDRDSLTRHVKDVLRALAPSFKGKCSDETTLGPDGAGLDSVGCLEVILELEARTGIVIRDERLTAEALATVGSLVDFLASADQRAHG